MNRTEISDPETPAFLTIAEIRAANRRLGHYFFDQGTMRFFNSEVYGPVFGGRWFITAERMELDMPRLWTIRIANADGSIDTWPDLDGFQKFETYGEAERVCLDLEAGRTPTV